MNWHHRLGLMVRQDVTEGVGGGTPKQQQATEREKGPGPTITFKGIAPMTKDHLPDSTS